MKEYKTIIEARKIHRRYFKDIFLYRELFWVLAWRDILVRYKQTIIGVSWSVLRPLLTMLVFTVMFGKIAKLPSNNAPYAIMVFCGMLPWQFFSNTLNEGGNSLISNSNMISKVYFPRIIIPTSSIIVSFIDLLTSIAILGCIMIYYQFLPNWKIIFIIFPIIMVVMVSLGAAYFVSALNVKYRDFKYVVPFVIQFGLYISPVGFSSTIIPDKWKILYSINPLVGIIDGFRWCIIGDSSVIYIPGLMVSITTGIICFLAGFCVFRKTEREFADLI